MIRDPLRIGLVQQSCGKDPAANLQRSIECIAEAAALKADLVLLQELHTHRYCCQTEDPRVFDLAEKIPGPTTGRLANAAKTHNVVVVGSVFERRASGLYHNTAVVLDRDGRLAGRYRKMHIPDDPGYHEKFYFTPGDQGFVPVDTSIGRLGVLVCWDQWYPEAARMMALAGAELLLYPTAIGWDDHDDAEEQARQLDAWQTIQRSHAVANGLPLACCNRTGSEPHPNAGPGAGIRFWGSSFVAGPQGEVLAQAPTDRDAVMVCTISRQRTEDVRRAWPFLRDRRIDAYDGLGQRFLDADHLDDDSDVIE